MLQEGLYHLTLSEVEVEVEPYILLDSFFTHIRCHIPFSYTYREYSFFVGREICYHSFIHSFADKICFEVVKKHVYDEHIGRCRSCSSGKLQVLFVVFELDGFIFFDSLCKLDFLINIVMCSFVSRL